METNKSRDKRMEIKSVKSLGSFLISLDKFPFKIKRIYHINNLSYNNVRGKHSHKKTRQIITCIQGSCTLKLEKESIHIDSACSYLLEPHEYHEITEFSSNCILLVLASKEYDENDYIREENSK